MSRRYANHTTSGNKAKCDYEDVAASMGAVNLGMRRSFGGGKVSTFFLNLCGVVKCTLSLRRGDTLLLQYPVKKYFTFLCRVAHLHGASVLAYIHDLGSMRRRKLTTEQEIKRLNHADHIISANDSMSAWLVENGIRRAVTALGLHTYLTACRPEATTHAATPSVCYACGFNKRKNTFLMKLGTLKKPFTLHQYGGAPADFPSAENNIVQHGTKKPDEFISHSEGDFGLVWDGDSTDGCSGAFGEYLRYNTPHKCSFYLVAGKPLIVWSKSAMAPYVRRLGIGIEVNSLEEIADALASVTPERMATMRSNVAKVAGELATGKNFSKHLSSISCKSLSND